MTKEIFKVITCSYNKYAYDKAGVNISAMNAEEFLEFADNDEVNDKTVRIYDNAIQDICSNEETESEEGDTMKVWIVHKFGEFKFRVDYEAQFTRSRLSSYFKTAEEVIDFYNSIVNTCCDIEIKRI